MCNFKAQLTHIVFPRASERRVLPIVGVCISSSYLHIFTSLSSHLLIFSLSLLSSLLSLSPVSLPFLSLAFFIFLSLGRGWCRRGVTKRQPFRNEGRSSKTEEKLRFYLCRSNPFARNEGRSAKTEVKVQFYLCRSCLCVKASVCKKRLCVKVSVCKSVCV